MFPDYLEVANRVWFCKKNNNSKIKHKKNVKLKEIHQRTVRFPDYLQVANIIMRLQKKKKKKKKSKNNPNKLFISDGLLVPDYSEVTTAVVVPRIGGRTSPHISI